MNHAWFRGGWWDPLTMAWKDVASASAYARPPITEGDPSPGATLFVPLTLAPGASRTISVRLAWYSPHTRLRRGTDPGAAASAVDAASLPTHQPWYAGRFPSIDDVGAYWGANYADLRQKSQRFADTFYDTTLPPEVVEAVAANLTILKSPTILRQLDGRLWAWEGCFDQHGCCSGTCTHVWNYAQAVAHLFPVVGAHAARDGVRSVAGRARPPGLPHRAPDSPAGARLPRRERRAAWRDHEGASRLAHQRRHARGSAACGPR